MLLRNNVINLFLAAILILLVIKSVNIFSQKDDEFNIKEITNRNNDKNIDNSSLFSGKKTLPAQRAFDEIEERSLFSETRERDVATQEAVSASEPKDSAAKSNKITLYGVIMLKDHKKALIANPEKTPETPGLLWIKEGERVGNITVDSIEESAIVIVDGKEKIRVHLYDKNKAKRTIVQSTAPSSKPNVINTDASPPEKEKKVPETKKSEPSKEEYEIIRTPFGELKRRKN